MKKLLLSVMFVFTFMFFAGSVTVEAKNKPVVENLPITSVEEVYESDTLVVELWAGQNIYMGEIYVTFVDGEIIIDWNGIDYTEFHVGTYSYIPSSRPAPGRMVDNGYELNVEFVLVIHAALPSGETAYAGERNFEGRGAWFYYIPLVVVERPVVDADPVFVAFHAVWGSETVFAVGNSTLIDLGLTNSRWGWTNGPLEVGTYRFELYAGAAQNNLSKGTYLGDLVVVWNGTEVTFTLELNDGVEFTEVHIHVDYLQLDALQPGQFGWTLEETVTDGWTVSLLPEQDRV